MNILAVNPWIYDFAAYDFWLKPYGFLILLETLKNKGHKINFIDCLQQKTTTDSGKGRLMSEIIPKPKILKDTPRDFRRYGITPDTFKELIKQKQPDLILLTSGMSYWYPGVKEAANILKKQFSDTPIILGGVYATLCQEHAKKNIAADMVVANSELNLLSKYNLIGEDDVKTLFHVLPNYQNFYSSINYAVFRTSWGCPFDCSYCAIKKLTPSFRQIPITEIINFIIKHHQIGVTNFALYDDAFLCQPEHAKKILRQIKALKLNIKIHTPNALHLRFLDDELAALIKNTGFIQPRFGLETLNPNLQQQWQSKATNKDLIRGLELLKQNGFNNGDIIIYLLLGYPKQNLDNLRKNIRFLHDLGVRTVLSEFSPVPKTKLYDDCPQAIKDEPLLHNNSIFPLLDKQQTKKALSVKKELRQLNKQFD
jgi:tRNA A37 methylthiotransferase MiaB